MSDLLGERIRGLRIRAGMQSRDLAARIGVEPSVLSKIEGNDRSVKTDELARIADALGVSPLAILEPESLLARLPLAARVPSATPVSGAVHRRLIALAELHSVLADDGIVIAAKLELPQIKPGKWLATATSLAEWASSRLDVAPGADRFQRLADSAEAFGIDVLVEPHVESILGAAITDPEFPLIFVNANQPRHRGLFTLAHEIGHVLRQDGESLICDATLEPSSDSERFANAFAATLLMPAAAVNEAIANHGRSARSLVEMLTTFEVSFESLIYRLHNLRVMNADGRKKMLELGWSGLLSAVKSDEDRTRLLGYRSNQTDSRPPSRLAVRLLLGCLQGTVSVRPLADLLAMDVDEALSLVEKFETDLSQVFDHQDFSNVGINVSDEELFEGSPV